MFSLCDCGSGFRANAGCCCCRAAVVILLLAVAVVVAAVALILVVAVCSPEYQDCLCVSAGAAFTRFLTKRYQNKLSLPKGIIRLEPL